MNDSAYRRSRLGHKLDRAFLALLAATILIGSTNQIASASLTLAKFEAKWQTDNTILVVWETTRELDSTAFFLYRAESSSGPWTDYVDFEPATGSEFTGASYTFVDDEVSVGATYYYRLEETAADGSSNFFGPITAAGHGTAPATVTPTATESPNQNLPPTTTSPPDQDLPSAATREYTDTPLPAAPVQAVPTRALTPLVTTPTPVGGTVPTPTLSVTTTQEPEPVQPTATATATEILTLPTVQETPAPAPTLQKLVAAPRQTSQPLLDASAAQFTPAPVSEASNNTPSSRLVLFLGGGALMAAAALGALAVLIWRRRGG
jgi:hypothetical protein